MALLCSAPMCGRRTEAVPSLGTWHYTAFMFSVKARSGSAPTMLHGRARSSLAMVVTHVDPSAQRAPFFAQEFRFADTARRLLTCLRARAALALELAGAGFAVGEVARQRAFERADHAAPP